MAAPISLGILGPSEGSKRDTGTGIQATGIQDRKQGRGCEELLLVFNFNSVQWDQTSLAIAGILLESLID